MSPTGSSDPALAQVQQMLAAEVAWEIHLPGAK
jgi:hypothetical protein